VSQKINLKAKNVNPIIDEFHKLKIINKKRLLKISNQTRDKKVKVYRDPKTKVILLEKYLTGINYYQEIKQKEKQSNKYLNKFTYTKINDFKYIKTANLQDDIRRNLIFRKFLLNKSILDYGCGWGSFLHLSKNIAQKLSGIEIRTNCINFIKKKSNFITLKKNLDEFDEKFDTITLFHVLEHLPNQVKNLILIRKKLKNRGKIIIEVPSAQDLLLNIENFYEFKKFTFWSEHLVLHTEYSLKKILKNAGFKKIKISFLQRYDLNNHIGWFLKKKPGGHEFYKSLFLRKENEAYKEFLIKIKKTDTLIAVAE
jgi:2-polyprenyl-3-methyl-5-hydroxy-6-metoxy-1,4-benzoquinol methylase